MPPPIWGAFIQNILSTYAQTEAEQGLDDKFAAEGSEARCARPSLEKLPRKTRVKNCPEKRG